MKTTKILKISAIVIGIGTALLLLMITVAVFWLYNTLKSPEAMQSHIPTIQQILKDNANLDTKFESLSLDLKDHIEVKGFQLNWSNEDGINAVVSTPLIKIRYDIANILDKKFEVTEVLIDQPSSCEIDDRIGSRTDVSSICEVSSWQGIDGLSCSKAGTAAICISVIPCPGVGAG